MNKLATTQILEEVLKKKIGHEHIEKFLWHEEERTGERVVQSKFLLHPRNFHSDSDEDDRKILTQKNKSKLKSAVNNKQPPPLQMKKVTPPREPIPIGDSKDINKVGPKKEEFKSKKEEVGVSKTESDKKAALNYDKKFPQLVAKTLKLLNEIKETLEQGIQLPDGDEDEQRRLKRLQEFALRFSRNYIYPLLRQMDEVLTLDKDSAYLSQKILLTYSPINLGLQAYCNFLPNSIGKCATDKLRTVIDQLLHLVEIQEQQKCDQELIRLMKESIYNLLEAVSSFNKRNDCKTPASKKSKTSKKNNKVSVPSGMKVQAKLSRNLSVYSASASFRKDEQFKKTVEMLSKKKYNVKSRYLTALFKHRPPTESKAHIVAISSKPKIFQKRSSTILRNTPINSPLNEDALETMIGIGEENLKQQQEIRADEQATRESDKGDGNQHQQTQQQQQQTGEQGDIAKNFNILKQCLSDKNMLDVIRKFIEENEEKNAKEVEEKQPKLCKKDSVLAVTGPKNAKLICIRDERDSESLDEEQIERIIQPAVPQQQQQQEKAKERRPLKLLQRIETTTRRPLKLLPNDKTVSVIQYNLDYRKFTQKNPMYKKSVNMQPTSLVGRMSDELLYELLQEFVDEIEVDSMLVNIYNAEFQYE